MLIYRMLFGKFMCQAVVIHMRLNTHGSYEGLDVSQTRFKNNDDLLGK
jgi:hypothetical protein